MKLYTLLLKILWGKEKKSGARAVVSVYVCVPGTGHVVLPWIFPRTLPGRFYRLHLTEDSQTGPCAQWAKTERSKRQPLQTGRWQG